jgi:zeaxanthin glucosyltransferase
MATVIIYMLQQPGHLIPSYRIAEQLQEKGHKIIYFGLKEFKKEIVNYGFKFEEMPETYNNEVKQNKWNRFVPKKVLQIISNIKDDFLYNTVMLVVEKFKQYKPDLVLLDDLYTPYIIALYQHNIPVVMISAYLCSEKDKNVPPPSSTYIPKSNFFSKIWIELLWLKVILRFRVNTYFGYYSQNKKIAKSSSFPLKERINRNRFHVFGIKDIPTIVLYPKVFDFPRDKKPNRYFVGIKTIIDQKIIPFNWKKIDLSKPIIYCSLGTQAKYHFHGSVVFFNKIIEIFRNKPNYSLIISAWKDIDINKFDDLPLNVKIFNQVPQTEVLKKASLLITHGGMGTLRDAIFYGVPMLVYPVNLFVDQNGNAARVFYHKIGLRGNIRKDSINEIKRKINQILNTDLFYKNIKSMQGAFIDCEQNSNCIEIIERYIKKQEKTELVKRSVEEQNEIYSQ